VIEGSEILAPDGLCSRKDRPVFCRRAIEDGHAALQRILGAGKWQVAGASTVEDAKAVLLVHSVLLVICAAPLCDRRWKSWPAETCRLSVAPKPIVSSGLACESRWAEALSLGCYAVWSRPYVASQVLRVVSLVWRRWRWDCSPSRGTLKAASFGYPV